MCISKEIAVSHYVDLTVKFFKEIFEITYSEGEGWLPIKDVQEWGVLRPKLDVCG